MHLLIMSCSAKKNMLMFDVPAVDLYDGVFYSVLKKTLRERPNAKKEVFITIISAKYGLLKGTDHINPYDLKMTPKIAISQREANTQKLETLLERIDPQDVTVVMGKTYLQSIDFSRVTKPIRFINGPIGMMLHAFKEWLMNLDIGGCNAD